MNWERVGGELVVVVVVVVIGGGGGGGEQIDDSLSKSRDLP